MDFETRKIKGCNYGVRANGYCRKHNYRIWKNGTIKTLNERHGMCYTTIYKKWASIKDRCYNPNNRKYKNYGGRGIIVCDRWLNSFSNFYEDVGDIPFKKAHLDRKENDGNYEPGNCRWVTLAENNRNKRNNVVNWFTVRFVRRLHKLHKFTNKELTKIYNISMSALKHIIYNQQWVE